MPTQLFLLDVVTDPISNINVSLMWTQVRVILILLNQFYLHKKVLKNSMAAGFEPVTLAMDSGYFFSPF